MARLLSVLFLLFANLELAFTLIVSENPIDSIPGNSVYFLVKPNVTRNVSTSWKFNTNTVIATGQGSSAQYSPAYKGRAELFTDNGTLRLDAVTLTDSGLYKVDVSDITSGYASSAEITLRVHVPLSNASISISPVKDIFIQDEDKVTMKCSVKGSFPTYAWSFGGKPLPENPRYTLTAENSSLLIHPLKTTDNEDFICNVTNIVSTVESPAVKLKICVRVSNVRISVTPEKDVFTENVDKVTLKCSATGTDPIYSWKFDGKTLPENPRYTLSADNSSLSIKPVHTSDSKAFVCTASNAVSSDQGKVVTLKIFARVSNVGISVSPAKDTYTDNVDDVTLKCSATGTDPIYSWNFDGKPLLENPRYTLSADNSSLSIRPVKTTDNKEFVCTASNAVNSAQGKAVTLKIFARISNVSVSISPTSVGFVEDKDTVTLKCAAGGTTPTYSWSAAEKPLPENPRYTLSADHSGLTIKPVLRSDSEGLICIATNAVSSDRSKSVNLTIYYGPDSAQTSTTAERCGSNYPGQYCVKEGAAVTLLCQTQSVPDCNYTWLHNGDTTGKKPTHVIQSAAFSNTGNYTCFAENSYTKKSNDSVVSILVYKQPSGEIMCGAIEKGDQIDLSCSWAGGVPNTTIALTVESVTLTGSNEQHYTIAKKDLSPLTELLCTGQHVISKVNCKLVLDEPKLSSPSSPQLEVALNADVALAVSLTERVRGSAAELLPATFAWSKANTPITASDTKFTINSNHTFSQLSIKSFETADAGKYTCLAKNAIGEKAFEFAVSLKNEAVNVGLIVGATIGALAGLVIISLLVFYIYRKKKRGAKKADTVELNESDKSNNEDDVIDPYMTVTKPNSFKPADEVIDPYLTVTKPNSSKPADVYAKVNKSNKGAPADVYAQVNKPNKMKNAANPADLYAQVNKSNKPANTDVPHDLYARVNKPHKGKVAAQSAWLFNNNRSEEGRTKGNM